MSLLPWLFSAALAATPPSVGVGSPALQFTLPAINEEAARDLVRKPQVGLSDFVGIAPLRASAAVVLYFFSRDHGGKDLVTLSRLQRRWSGKDVQVVAISTDSGDLGGLSTWIEGLKLNYPVLRDNHRVVARRYGIEEFPLTLVVDRDGYLFAIGQPSSASLEEELEAEIAPLVAK